MNSWATKHMLSALLIQVSTGWQFLVTNVYGTSVEAEKMEFIQELRMVQRLVNSPWALMGDFNMVRWYVDRSADIRGYSLMCAYNDMVRDFELLDVELRNRAYTWSNKQPVPVFSRLDRIFLTNQWSLAYPKINLREMEMIVSDHVPLLLSCSMQNTAKAPARLETFWL